MQERDLVYSHGSTELCGHLCGEVAGEKRPGVLVFHDAMGLGTHAIERAQRLGNLGYVALAADLYGNRLVPRDTSHALEILRRLRNDPVHWRARASSALDALRSVPGVDCSRMGAIGFCFGGSTALELARGGAALLATCCFHGGLDTQRPAGRDDISGSILVCTGSNDPLVPAAQIQGFLDEMSAAGVDCQVTVYAGVQHSFTNLGTNGLPGMAYDARADKRSWAAMCALFDDVMGGVG